MILTGLIVAAVGIALVEVVVRRSDVGAGLVLGAVVLEEVVPVELSASLGPARVGLSDVLLMVLLTAAIARLLRVERLTTTQRLLVGFGLVVVWALVRGFEPFGATAAINEARKFLRFAAIALYFSTVEPRRDLIGRIGRLWVLAAVILAGVSLLRWVATAAGISGGPLGQSGSMRVVPSDTALIIAQGALIALAVVNERARDFTRFLAPVLLVVVLLLQHRTVWLASAIGLLYLLYRRRASIRMLAAFGAGMVVFAALTFTIFGEEDLSQQLAESGQSTATLEWRIAGWDALLTDRGPERAGEVALGKPFGGGWGRNFDGRFVDVSPHNFYLESYLRVGVIGVLALLSVYAIALRGPGRSLDRHSFGPSSQAVPRYLVQTLVGMQLLYYLTYSPDVAQALLLGLACAMTVRSSSAVEGRLGAPESVR